MSNGGRLTSKEFFIQKKTAPYDESSLFCIMVLTLSVYNSPTWCYAYRLT